MTRPLQKLAVALSSKAAHNNQIPNLMRFLPKTHQAPVKRCAHTWRSLLAATVHRSGERFSSACSFPFKTTREALRPSRLPLLEETEFDEKGRNLWFAACSVSSQQEDCSQQLQRG